MKSALSFNDFLLIFSAGTKKVYRQRLPGHKSTNFETAFGFTTRYSKNMSISLYTVDGI